MYICLCLNGGLKSGFKTCIYIHRFIYLLVDTYGLIINGLWSLINGFTIESFVLTWNCISKLLFPFRSHVSCTACQAPGLWYVKFTNDYISALICTVSKPSTILFLPYANQSLDTFDRVSIPQVIPCPSLRV